MLFFVFGVTPIVCAAGPGDLDTTFNNTGIVTTTIGIDTDGDEAVAIQTDGKIVVTGGSFDGNNYNVAVARYDDDGNLDTDFNTTGVVTTPVTSGFNGAHAVAIQPSDDKIVVVGEGVRLSNLEKDIVVVRYQDDGKLDTTFGGTGFITTSISSGDDSGQSVAIQPDGKIVVAGDSYRAGIAEKNIALVRYDSNGNLDATFNNTGVVTTSVGDRSWATAVTIQTDNKIVVAGASQDSGNHQITVARYNITGTLDTEFNNTGIVTTMIGSNARANAIAIQADGKIVVVGSGGDSNSDFAVVRYQNDGKLDVTFGNTGIVTTSVSNESDFGMAVAIQSNGKIIAAGASNNTNPLVKSDFTVICYNEDGSLDTGFGGSGVVTTSIGASDINGAYAVALQPDDKIVVSGISRSNNAYDYTVVRYIGNSNVFLPIIYKDR